MRIKKARPLLNHVVTTANVYKEDVLLDGISGDSGIDGQFKEYQTVVAVGPNVSTVKPGDIVLINPQAYARPIHKQKEDSITGLMGDSVEMVVQFPILDIDNVPHLFIYDRDIDLIIEEMDEDDNPDNII